MLVVYNDDYVKYTFKVGDSNSAFVDIVNTPTFVSDVDKSGWYHNPTGIEGN